MPVQIKKKHNFISHTLALSLLLGTASCAEMQGIVHGVPIGSTEVASFTTTQGQEVDIMQPPGTSQYELYAPGTAWQSLDLLMLGGFNNLTFVGSEQLGVQTAALFKASDDTCSNRYILLVLSLPNVLSTVFKSCDSNLEMIPQSDGVSLGFVNDQAVPPYHYVYRDNALYGPIYDQPEAPVYHHYYSHHTDKKHADKDNKKTQNDSSKRPVDLDDLSVPANTNAVNLDTLGK